MPEENKKPKQKPVGEMIINDSGTIDNDSLLTKLQSNNPPPSESDSD